MVGLAERYIRNKLLLLALVFAGVTLSTAATVWFGVNVPLLDFVSIAVVLLVVVIGSVIYGYYETV